MRKRLLSIVLAISFVLVNAALVSGDAIKEEPQDTQDMQDTQNPSEMLHHLRDYYADFPYVLDVVESIDEDGRAMYTPVVDFDSLGTAFPPMQYEEMMALLEPLGVYELLEDSPFEPHYTERYLNWAISLKDLIPEDLYVYLLDDAKISRQSYLDRREAAFAADDGVAVALHDDDYYDVEGGDLRACSGHVFAYRFYSNTYHERICVKCFEVDGYFTHATSNSTPFYVSPSYHAKICTVCGADIT